MPSTILPPIPHLIFAVIEPISLIAGWAFPLADLPSFIHDQVPNTLPPASIHPTSTALAYQLSNLYGLLFLLGAGVLYSTSEPVVVRNYFIALAIADVGHVYVTYLAMGWEKFVDVAGWNPLTWGNVAVTGALFVCRLAYLAGCFGGPKVVKWRGKRA